MQITTDRLILRDFTAEDWPAVLAYQNDPLYLRYNDWAHRTPEDVQEFVGWFLAQQNADPRFKFQFAVTLKDSGDLIGNCGIRQEAPNSHRADIGYELDPKHWGLGYATEAARAVIAFGFTELGLNRIEADCLAENTGSAHVLEKVGMRLEGRLRDHKFFKERYWDTLLYGMLISEWGGS